MRPTIFRICSATDCMPRSLKSPNRKNLNPKSPSRVCLNQKSPSQVCLSRKSPNQVCPSRKSPNRVCPSQKINTYVKASHLSEARYKGLPTLRNDYK